MNVPVIILNWNGWDDTFECLRSIKSANESVLVWLVDNASGMNRLDEACVVYPGLRTFRWDQNYGWAGGYNRALRIALEEGYRFAYLLNNDCSVSPGFLSSVLRIAATDRKVAAVGSTILYASAPEFVLYDGDHYDLGEHLYIPSCGARNVKDVHGAGMLLSLVCAEEYGLFEEAFFFYGEEADWSKRMIEHGCRLAVSNESVVLHYESKSDVNHNKSYYLCRNKFLHLNRARDRSPTRFLRGMLLFYLAVRNANEQRRAGNHGRAMAIADALWHVAHRQFGPRGPSAPPLFYYLVTHSWPFSAGLIRHSRFVRLLLSTVRPMHDLSKELTGVIRSARR